MYRATKTCILKRLMWFEGWLVCCRVTSIYTQLYVLVMAGAAVAFFFRDFLLFLLEPINIYKFENHRIAKINSTVHNI